MTFRALLAVLALATSSADALAGPLVLALANATVTDVSPTGSPFDAIPGLSISLSPESAAAFGDFTAANIGKTIELRLEGKVVASGIVREAITNGRLRVEGGPFTRTELRNIATRVPDGVIRLEVEVVAPKP
jgi:preprotein translocase subunit SecD